MMNAQRKRFWILLPLLLASAALTTFTQLVSANSASVSGVVLSPDGPTAGARVRIRATDNLTWTDGEGAFKLDGLVPDEMVEVTAWADGYYIASVLVTPTVSGLELNLRPYHSQDHPDYAWISPVAGSSEKACGNCHPMIVSQWENNAHGQAISNARFFSLYNGTSLDGSAQVPPGYLADFPSTAGNCASCHAPGAGLDAYLTTDMNMVREVITAGVQCDFCHKTAGVYLDPASGTVYPNAPGVESMAVLRPPAGEQIFFGPYDDIADPDTYLPLISESQFCAPCHQFSFWGIPIYESYNEWLTSPYAGAGITCQDCHMPPTGDSYFALPEMGGLPHPPESIPSHLQLGAVSQELLAETVILSLQTAEVGDQIQVTVVISNSGAGHHVPTDYPGRHLILTVSAAGPLGNPLSQASGPTVPAWGGSQAGLAGKAFAKQLQDIFSGEMPVVSYWSQTRIVADNRIPALGSDISIYTFSLPSGLQSGSVTVTAELRFRRLFQDLMTAKGWQSPDILMEQASERINLAPHWHLYLPALVTP